MRVLAIDTAAEIGVVAVTDGGAIRIEIASGVRAKHGETLLGNVERALSIAGMTIADIELIAVGLGPGSFTGVRIGVATVKGLSIARRTPVVGVRTTRAIARGAFGALRVPVVDAHKGEVFAAVYAADVDGRLETRVDELHGKPEDVGAHLRAIVGTAHVVLVGSGVALYGDRFTRAIGSPCSIAPRALDVPRGSLIALEAEETLAARGPDDLASLVPLYVRASDAALPSGALPAGGAPAAGLAPSARAER